MPKMIILDDQGYEGNMGFSDAWNLPDDVCHKSKKLIIVVREHLYANIGLPGGTPHVTDKFVFSDLLGHLHHAGGLHFNKNIRKHHHAKTFGVHVSMDGDHLILDQAFNAIAHCSF